MIDETRVEQVWQQLRDDAGLDGFSSSATLEFTSWFGTLSGPDRHAVLPVLSSWICSSHASRQFDALSVVGAFRLWQAIPALEELSGKLTGATSRVDRFLRVKVLRLLADLLEDRAMENK